MKKRSKMNTRSDREYTKFVPTQLLRNLLEQRPSNEVDLDYSVTGDTEIVYYMRTDLLLI
jgi:hypothetical protein